MNRHKNTYLTTLLLFLSFLISGCVGTSYLKEGELLLNKQSIERTPKDISHDALLELLVQTPNRRLPIIPVSPYIAMYQIGKRKFDTAKYELKKIKIEEKFDHKIAALKQQEEEDKVKELLSKKTQKLQKIDKKITDGNNFMRWGEPLAIYDPEKTNTSKRKIENYLKTEGYFAAKVLVNQRFKRKKYNESFIIKAGEPHQYDSIHVNSQDTLLIKTLKRASQYPFILSGERYSESKLKTIRGEIEGYLNNHGYYDFDRSSIFFEADTLHAPYKVNITININLEEEKMHKAYHIASITFRTDANIKALEESLTSKYYKDILFKYTKNRFKKKYLEDRVFIQKNDFYNKSLVINTQKQLANLDMFRYVNVNFNKRNDSLDVNIFTSPLQKFQTNSEIGLNVSEQGYPGPLVKFSFKNRNLTKRLDILDFNSSASIEGLPSQTDVNNVFQSQIVNGNFKLSFPSFIFPFGNRIKDNLNLQNLRTQFTLGASYTNRPDFTRHNFSTTMGYRWRRSNSNYLLTINDLSLITTPRISNAFEQRLIDLLSRGNNLINSFQTSFVSSIFFQDVIRFNNYGLEQNKSAYLKLFFESGGTFLKFYKNFIDTPTGFEFYRFWKTAVDFRQILSVSKNNNNVFAFRVKLGLAKPYGDNNALPYEKYFFSGGSSSIRGWAPRRLGPGSFATFDENGNYVENFEQFGEMQFEANIEFRRNLIGILDGAFFIDAGNVWSISENDSRPNSQFSFDRFYKEIAVSAGIGLRFDFQFLIFRFDTALKTYDPAREEGRRFILKSNFKDPAFTNQNLLNYNIGIGYPF